MYFVKSKKTFSVIIKHIANHNLPFGGTGNSGIGNYHGKYSFTAFSHQKGILKNPFIYKKSHLNNFFSDDFFMFQQELIT